MANESVGQVSLDLVLNSKEFKNQLTNTVNNAVSGVSNNATKSLTGAFSKIGKAALAAFSVGAVVKFGKECLDLGSDLAEVQNVVDSTFTTMSDKVNEFASTAISKYGLSETVTKKYVGTFGAMAKAFNFTEGQALEMSETLTALTGDVASFYNLSSDEAYTKLKSVFTGETESLKQLGVVMTQTALDQFALENGFGKTTKKMTEQEKVALRYAFVQDKLKTASGDFIRTQDGWANQTRVLALQFESLKAQIGQGLISALTPVIKMINILMSKLVALATSFKGLMEKIFGVQEPLKSAKATEEVSASYDNVGDSIDDTSKKAEKAAKKANKSLLAFDKINKLAEKTDTSTGTTGAGTGGISPIDGGLVSAGTDKVKEANKELGKLQNTLKKVKDLFTTGFKDGFGVSNIDLIKEQAKGIATSLKDIFTDKDVLSSASTFSDAVITNLGVVVGSAASIGQSIAVNLTSGLNNALAERKDSIKEHLKSMFDIYTDISNSFGKLAKAIATIFESLKTPKGIKMTTKAIELMIDTTSTISEIGATAARDFIDMFVTPISDNAEGLKNLFSDTFGVIGDVIEGLDSIVNNFAKSFKKNYNKHFKPLLDALKKGWSDTVGKFLKSWKTNVQPTLDKIGEEFKELVDNYINPMVDSIMGFLGAVADFLKPLYEKVLKPVIDWLIDKALKSLGTQLSTLWNVVKTVIKNLTLRINGVFTTFKGLFELLTGFFTKDKKKVLDGFKDIAEGLLKMIGIDPDVVKKGISTAVENAKKWMTENKAKFEAKWQDFTSHIKDITANFKAKIATTWSDLKDTWDNLKERLTGKTADFKAKIATRWSDLKDNWKNLKDKFTGKTVEFKASFKDAVTGAINSLISRLNTVIAKLRSFSIAGAKPFSGLKDIPKLAQGGYVKANTPQLAMIGDNRHQGEIVAPEGKIRDIVSSEMQQMTQAMNTLISIMAQSQGQQQPQEITVPVYIGNELIDTQIINAQKRNLMRTGGR